MLKAKQLAEWILDYTLFEQATLDEGSEYELEVINKCRDIIHDKIVYVIETNLSIPNHNGVIVDHQSRIIEADSWDSYIEEFKTGKSINKRSLGGCGNGATIPYGIFIIKDLEYDEFHLSADIYYENGTLHSKKLAYLIRQ